MGEAGQALGVSGPFLPAPLSLPPTHRNTLMAGVRGMEKGGGKKGLLFLTTPPQPGVATSCHQFQLADPITQSWGEVAEGRTQGGSWVPLLYLITIIV